MLNEGSTTALYAANRTDAPLTQKEPYLIIKPTSGWQALQLEQIWRFKDLLLTLARRDVTLRYRQTALGVGWVVLQPLIAAGIFAFVFGAVAKLPSGGTPYFVFSYAGLLSWNLFSTTVSRASVSLTGNSQLISKVYFPRLILPLSGVFSTLLDFIVATVVMVALMFFYHITPGIGLLLLPLWMLLITLLALGIGLTAAALAVTYRDVLHILPVMVQMTLYASPVAYATVAVPEHLRPLYLLNPMANLIEAFRWSLLGTGQVSWKYMLGTIIVVGVVFIGGAFAFKRMERKFADVI
ncbi:MAG: ABC transporter permease [Pyrinomonadaceae bacterium MAG19_C2-C3]|nr:ABC transporter permease [Pyrinomonadaceae bacterium MAG19_C2-C3]